MATKRKPAPVSASTKAVQAYRQRTVKAGGSILYCTIDRETADALLTIREHRICSARDAVQTALARYAREVTRKR